MRLPGPSVAQGRMPVPHALLIRSRAVGRDRCRRTRSSRTHQENRKRQKHHITAKIAASAQLGVMPHALRVVNYCGGCTQRRAL